jgi:hypothetical protein
MTRTAIITYDGLPISSGGAHQLRTHGPREAWSSVEPFLKKCTDYAAPKSLFVEVFEGQAIPKSFSDQVKKRFSQDLGNPKTRVVGKSTGNQYDVSLEQFNEVLDFLDGLQPYPPSPLDSHFGPVTLNLLADFRFIDQTSRMPLPHQDRNEYLNFEAGYRLYLGCSTIYAILSSKSTVSVFFSLPYEEATKELKDYVRFLQSHLPFRMSDKHWKRWHMNKALTGYIGRKISNIVS